jgi:hypothetical protein
VLDLRSHRFTRLPPFCALHPGNKRTYLGTGYSVVCQYNRLEQALSMKWVLLGASQEIGEN